MSQLERAESQLAELELLSSMFPSQGEFELTDPVAVAELRGFVEGSADSPPPCRPRFLLKQKVEAATTEGVDVTLSCAYPSEYPCVLPEITVRCADLSRAQQTQLHADLNTHLTENCRGEVCVLSAVEWVKDNSHLYISRSASSAALPSKKESASPRPPELFSRLWIYSHHIYNKTKRKNILEWSKELGLTGFSMPGKPGIVCVEGPQSACEEFWSRVKVLTWKKIMIRHREDIPLDHQGMDSSAVESMDSLRKFTSFEEAMFDPHGNRGNHMDLGLLYQFLNEKGCCDVFQIYFGIEGR
ncbi:RWD domain-containing protein 2B [Myripristis murdjan]|uniref:RWD domain containing 2B n=1 Tax=Myripristis murdjan TaxID=586833 RepID=A0A667Y296_9TELE|nr:RWD domain-containing protein 2B [Myripristis murdjan]